MTLAVCPGSFDPLTLGHIDVIKRARGMFDDVVVAVSHNAKKAYLFSLEERVELAREALAGVDGVRVEVAPGLIADFAREAGAAAIVKGLRGAADYDAEQAMALLNRHLSRIETVFIMGDPALSHIASSFVKEIASYGGTIDDLVTPNVARALRKVNS
ncbi:MULTISPECIES: pantetheine-phosphate adenylyltransferase [Trueperella]|uniref:Phosphopantetheine adenylyltransferase n=1 Tax=Trueperella abortisuis TaxID=445930 RepID=A0ABT9PJR0_9ACTO|nr:MULTISPECIES: pantetheine-phosphate adenylyltransferase [Trueperella]MDP9832697.1 pantetheine-phosphate adenylyltransferase [Trueperella abortisuis]MDY5404540.1 pantetheine-phosphate adenylyltransferase [Trueperella sp.]